MDASVSLFYTSKKIVRVFQDLHRMTPDDLNVFRFVNDLHTRNTRQRSIDLFTSQELKQVILEDILSLPEFIRRCKSFESAYLKYYFDSQ